MDTMVGLWAQGFKVSSPYAYGRTESEGALKAELLLCCRQVTVRVIRLPFVRRDEFRKAD